MAEAGSFRCGACREWVRASDLWFSCATCEGLGRKRRRYCEACGHDMRDRFYGPVSREGNARDERYALIECDRCTTDTSRLMPSAHDLLRFACDLLDTDEETLVHRWRGAQPSAPPRDRAARLASFVVSTYAQDRDLPQHARFILSRIPDLEPSDLAAALRRCDSNKNQDPQQRSPLGAVRR